MAKKHFTRTAFPATRRVTAAGVSIGDFVIVGHFKGFALEDTRTADDEAVDGVASLAGTVLIGFGEVPDVFLSADGALGGIAEGEYLKWDGSLDGGNGGFTDTGASATDFDAVAGLGAAVTAGGTGTGEVVIPAPY